ncbi:MAG: hypothetical protein QNJ77_01660 [Acidimicrobiia bacterium]|nr:hypothetical protein [Acidimicrobiia bacterium]
MSMFKGSLRIPNTTDTIDAVFEVGAESLRVTTGDEVLGDWSLTEVAVEDRGDGLLVTLDGESVIVDVPDRNGFAAALGPPTKSRRSRAKKSRAPKSRSKAGRPDSRPKSDAAPPGRPRAGRVPSLPIRRRTEKAVEDSSRTGAPQERKSLSDVLGMTLAGVRAALSIDNWREWLQDPTVRWSIASVGVILFALLALFATNTLGMILVLAGMVGLIIAALAVSDDLDAFRLMPNFISETGLVISGAVAMAIGGLLILIG